MTTMTTLSTTSRHLITLLGCATLWACAIERAPDRTAENASAITEDNGGSGSGSGSGSDTETCTAGDPPTQAQLDEAKAALKKYLKGCTGQAAVDKVIGEFDKNPKDGKLNSTELLALIKKLGLGWPVPQIQKRWCNGVMGAIDDNSDGILTQAELLKFLGEIGLGGPAQCVPPVGEDMPRSQGHL